MILQHAYRKLEDVRDEFHAAKFSLGQTLIAFNSDAAVYDVAYRQQIKLHHLDVCKENLQITYLVRLFGEFEGILRDYWLNGRKRNTRPPMFDLMNGIAAYCNMNADHVQDAHEVRDYRNEVIHNHRQNPLFDFQTCHSRLARFIYRLPQKW